MNSIINKALCLIVFLVVITNTFTQEANNSRKENSFWLTLGTGYSLPVNSLPVLVSNFTYDYNDNLFTLRYIMNRELKIAFGDRPLNVVHDIGLMYGRLFLRKSFSLTFSGGLSYVFGNKRGKKLPPDGWLDLVDHYAEVPISTVGVPLEGNLFFTPSKHFGFGFNLFGNINIEQSYIGIGFSAIIGDVLKLKKVSSP